MITVQELTSTVRMEINRGGYEFTTNNMTVETRGVVYGQAVFNGADKLSSKRPVNC